MTDDGFQQQVRIFILVARQPISHKMFLPEVLYSIILFKILVYSTWNGSVM